MFYFPVICSSRFETVTNVVTPTPAVLNTATPVGRAINLDKINVNQITDAKSEKKHNKEKVAKVDKNAATILSLNEGKIVDADGVSTLFYTTRAIGTYVNDLYTQLTEKTSSITIDETKKRQLAEANTAQVDTKHKTGLVRLIDGKIVANHTTTIYQSKVIGTIIDNRYAQIIESTSSYIIDKTQEPSIAPSATVSNEVKPTASVISPSAAVLEGSVNSESDGHYNEDESEDDEEANEEDGENADEVDENGRKKSRLTFATKKRTFTPIIRPFASRNRPTFAPKRKNLVASSATIITRSDFTPTITATPVSKAETSTRRFSGGRRSSNAPHVAATPSSSSVASSTFGASKRFSRLRSSSSAATPSSTAPSGSSRIRPTATRPSSTSAVHFGSSSSRRASNLFRSSSTLAGRSIAPTQVGRFRVNPTSSLAVTTPKVHDLDDVTTQDPNENAATESIVNDEDDDEIATTTDASTRRNQNPLLRFRRPLASSNASRFQPTTAPRSQSPVTVSTRRSPLQRSRSTQTTTTTTTTAKPKARSFQKPASLAALTNRPRVQSNNLFPPRGLFRQTTPAANLPEKDESNNVTGDANSADAQHAGDGADGDDIDVEGNEDVVDTEYDNRSRRENKAPAFTPQSSLRIRKRTKRQTDYGTRTARSRRPTSQPAPQQISQRVSYDDAYYDDIDYVTQKPQKAPSTRYQSRYRPPTPSPAPITDSNSESNHHSPNLSANNRNIRPTKASTQKSRSQFTLRSGNENKEVSSNSYTPPASRSSNFRRTQNTANLNNGYQTTTAARRKPLPQSQASRSKSSRLRSYSPYSDSRNGNSRSRGGTSSTRGTTRSSARSRNSRINSDAIDYEYVPQFDGTITVTHHVPTEVTIPVVNGKNTEYKNIITAKVSTEILGPNQYSTTTRGIGGNTALILTNEVTSLNNGATEITQFFLKETPTTSVTFTPTLIRGRKTSYSHVVPSTVYNVETVVSTIQPQISSNAPLANILLSQLLLGNFGLPQQQLLGLAQPQQQQLQPVAQTPTTEFKVRTTTYVTTVTDAKSTIIPVTFRGKEILTTVVESSKHFIPNSLLLITSTKL